MESLEECPSSSDMQAINRLLETPVATPSEDARKPPAKQNHLTSLDPLIVKSLNLRTETALNNSMDGKKQTRKRKSPGTSNFQMSKSTRQIRVHPDRRNRHTINHSPRDLSRKHLGNPRKKTISFQQVNMVKDNFDVNTNYRMTLLVNLEPVQNELVRNKGNFFDKNDIRRGSTQIFFRRGDEDESDPQANDDSKILVKEYLASFVVMLGYTKDGDEFRLETQKMKKFMLLIQKKFEPID